MSNNIVLKHKVSEFDDELLVNDELSDQALDRIDSPPPPCGSALCNAMPFGGWTLGPCIPTGPAPADSR